MPSLRELNSPRIGVSDIETALSERKKRSCGQNTPPGRRDWKNRGEEVIGERNNRRYVDCWEVAGRRFFG